MKYTTTVTDYLTWRGDIPFSVDPFNEVDNLVLCIISYLDFSRFPELLTRNPKEAADLEDICARLTEADDQLGLSQLSYIPVARQAAACERFAGTKMFAFEDRSDAQTQFAAVSFLLPDKSVFVAFRGTDTSLVGWKEDFNMSYLEAVPAQVRAAEYTAEIARVCRWHKLRIGGHSKGGNLAAWAAVHLDEKLQRKRLIAAYNNDGPGFSRDLVDTPSYQAVADRLFTYIPASSIVGVLLEHAEDYEVVDSTARSIMQHEPLSWCVEGPRFVHLGQRSQLGQLSDGVLREWIGSMSSREREQFSRAFFDILSRGGRTKTLEDLRSGGLAAGAALIREYAGADEEKKKIISEIFRRLAVDVKDELMKAAGAGVRRAGETILATGQAIADLRK